MTDQLRDDVTPQFVILIQLDTAEHGKITGFDGAVIFQQGSDILAVGITDHAD